MLLRKERAISRAAVWTAHCAHKIELRDKMGGFLARAMHHLCNRPLVVRDTPPAQRRSGALAAGFLRRLFRCYQRMRDHTAVQTFLTVHVSLRGLILDYKHARDKEMVSRNTEARKLYF
mmetsp:Transcript_15898/g.43128  ORF Transcript_15898/g.43128 Transcript_15898/m.43128 type:complete len:119 (+) Transcript_15898:364-720(+)